MKHPFKNLCASAGLFAIALTAIAPALAAEEDIPVNPEITEFHKRYAMPELEEVAPGIFAATAYDFSNFGFIEGKTGIIVVDTGSNETGFKAALQSVQKLLNKPVSALIITHSHGDHTGGGTAAVEAGKANIPIYGPSDYGAVENLVRPPVRELVLQRGIEQLGLVLPSIGIGQVGAGVGPNAPRGVSRPVQPTTLIDDNRIVEIDGVKVQFIRHAVDVPDSMLVWLPDSKVLFPGDIIGGVFPYIKTPRAEPWRSPVDMMKAIDLSLSLAPKVVVAGHGRVLADKATIDDVLGINRDLVQFLIDQIDRRLIAGQGVEQIVAELKLPAKIANHPDLQPHYHTRDWVIRAMVTDRVGFYAEPIDLFRRNGVDEAKRLIALIGDKKVQSAADASVQSDPRWAARLAYWLRQANPANAEAERTYYKALEQIAVTTTSVNERYYALTQKAVAEGRLNIKPLLQASQASVLAKLSNQEIIDNLGVRVNPDRAGDQIISVKLEVAVDKQPYVLHLRNQVLRTGNEKDPVSATIRINRDQLIDIASGKISASSLLEAGSIRIDGSTESARQLLTVIG